MTKGIATSAWQLPACQAREKREGSWSRIARVLSRRHFSPYKTYVRRDLGLMVLLNPKVGTTTIRQILFDELQKSGARPMLSRWWPLSLMRRYLTAPLGDYYHALAHGTEYQTYCFVRNPYTRLLSAWRDKFAFRHESGNYSRGTARFVPALRGFAASRNLPGQEAGAALPFSTFVAYVEHEREGRRNQHWDTQCSVLLSDLFPCDRVFRMETEFASGVIEILTRLGLPTQAAAEKLKRPQNASRKLAEPVYNAALARQVFRIYASDFRLFGYDSESWRGL